MATGGMQCSERSNGREALSDHSRETTNVISFLAGWNATQSHLLWDVAWTKEEQLIPAPAATTVTALTGKDFRNGFTRSRDSNLE